MQVTMDSFLTTYQETALDWYIQVTELEDHSPPNTPL